MGRFITFLTREEPWSGKAMSTANLIAGLNAIGNPAIALDCTNWKRDFRLKLFSQSKWYAVTCLENLDLLKCVPVAKRVAWIRQNPVTRPEPFALEGGVHQWIVTAEHMRANTQNSFTGAAVLPEAIILPEASEVNAVDPKSRQGLLFVGRVERSKGLSLLLNMMADLPRTPEFRLTIVGPSSRDVWGDINARWIHDQVLYARQKDPKPYYLKAKWLIAPCPHEPFGMPVVESLAHGCTPIAVRGSGGPDETLAGTPYLIDGSPDRFASAVLNRRPLHYDKALAMAEPYGHVAVAEKLVKILEDSARGRNE